MAHGEFPLIIRQFIKNLRLSFYRFGLAGESYFPMSQLEIYWKPFMESYFCKLPHEPWYVNRTRLYYSESFDEVYALAENLPRHSRLVQISEIPEETKRIIFFTLCEYMLVAISKLMTVGQPPQQLAEGYREFQRGLLETSESMLSAVFRDNFLPLPKLTAALSVVKKKAEFEGITTVRAYVEMDHKLILFLDYLLFYEEINRYEILLAPLIGGVMIPPIYIALHWLFQDLIGQPRTHFGFDYISYSLYDKAFCSQKDNMLYQIHYLKKTYNVNQPMLLIDDNVGSGKTLQTIQMLLNRHFYIVHIKAVEYHWEKQFRANIDKAQVFDVNRLDYVSPIAYRHYARLEQYITNLSFSDSLLLPKRFFPDYLDRYKAESLTFANLLPFIDPKLQLLDKICLLKANIRGFNLIMHKNERKAVFDETVHSFTP